MIDHRYTDRELRRKGLGCTVLAVIFAVVVWLIMQ